MYFILSFITNLNQNVYGTIALQSSSPVSALHLASYIWGLVVSGKEGTFDYISITPPYMLVDYAVLMDQVASIVGENTFVVSLNNLFQVSTYASKFLICFCLCPVGGVSFKNWHVGVMWVLAKGKPNYALHHLAPIFILHKSDYSI